MRLDPEQFAQQPPKQVTEPDIRAMPYVWRPASEIPPRQWLYGKHLIRGFASGTVAPGGTGKSALTITDALAMTTGRDLLGKNENNDPLTVWLWNLEDPRDEIERRICATCMHYGIEADDIGSRLFVNSGRDAPLVVAGKQRDATVIYRPVIEALVSEIQGNSVDVIVIDPFVSSHELPENDNSAIDAAVKEWARVASRAGCAVELVHHVRKNNTGNDTTAEDARGGKAFVDALRSVRVLNRMRADEAERAGIDDGQWRYFRAELGKSNMAPPPENADWCRLASVDLGQGDSVGVVIPWRWPDAFDDITVHDLETVQRHISKGEWRDDVRSPQWVGIAIAEALGLDHDSKPVKAKIKTMIKTWIGNDALRIERRRDPESRREKNFVVIGEAAQA